YYQRTVFEFISEDIGSKSTICGGGRYDGLVEELGGPRLPGIGFAMGLTRVMLALKASDKLPEFNSSPALYIASMGDNARLKSFEMSLAFKKYGLNVAFDQVGRSLKAQMKYADKIGAKYSIVLGDSELEIGKATLKNMKDGEAVEVDINDIKAIAYTMQN
ncbi:MAG: ATP phosphoribosyltransferase regulatory subunit, partial [Clostridia bacterium]|nr:ATP phosphoribosyltransferase regulatory subunit [Clostridia bacterium]